MLTPELDEKLNNVAADIGTTRSEIVRRALTEADFYALFESGKSKSVHASFHKDRRTDVIVAEKDLPF